MSAAAWLFAAAIVVQASSLSRDALMMWALARSDAARRQDLREALHAIDRLQRVIVDATGDPHPSLIPHQVRLERAIGGPRG